MNPIDGESGEHVFNKMLSSIDTRPPSHEYHHHHQQQQQYHTNHAHAEQDKQDLIYKIQHSMHNQQQQQQQYYQHAKFEAGSPQYNHSEYSSRSHYAQQGHLLFHSPDQPTLHRTSPSEKHILKCIDTYRYSHAYMCTIT